MRTALRISLIYLVAGALWILCSDWVLSFIFHDLAGYRMAQTYKGWFFVLVSAGALFLLIRRSMARVHAATRAHRKSEQKLRDLYENAPVGIFESTPEGRYLNVNTQLARIYGWGSPDQLLAAVSSIKDQIYMDPGEREEILRLLHDREHVVNYESRRRKKDGTPIWVSTNIRAVCDASGKIVSLEGFTTDITERKQAEAEQEKLSGQLQQAQKMEAVGRLAGGVAHDFNNMLQVILGYTDLALESGKASDPIIVECLENIQQAAERSSNLTRQLLAFARKQTIVPKVLDLNEIVAGSLKMLSRIIGENIDLVWLPSNRLWSVKMDPAQVDQVLANLSVNARDAIADVGTLTIETRNSVIDEGYCATNPECTPGEYVLLVVSDTGSGMRPKTLHQIFEPFFTTKGAEQGTGLGLATVYGIIKQNNGFITVYSEPEQGSAFRIYLPRYIPEPGETEPRTVKRELETGDETLLVVEDKPEVLALCRDLIESLGYAVLSAAGPEEAIALAREHPEEIHLLVTDVVMPEMSGKELRDRIRELRPGIGCLFMSGYTANVIAHHGVLEQGIHFIEKPFTKAPLGVKIRKALSGT